MKKIYIQLLGILVFSMGLGSCKKFIDIVPDNVATIANAFTMRTMAKRYLYTCYSYLPNIGHIRYSPAFLRGEIFPSVFYINATNDFVRGRQNVVEPILNYWEGRQSASVSLFEGIRNCNVFLENIYNVPDMQLDEKNQWAAEVKFLKAYYLFFLVRCYGPIPLMKTNLPIDANINTVRVRRQPVDSCFNYIVRLLDQAAADLPNADVSAINPSTAGRINVSIALSLKALVLVTAASPLFNGNADYSGYTDEKLGPLFNPEYSAEKWEQAMVAAKEAIENCEGRGYRLYHYTAGGFQNIHLSDTTIYKMSIRNSVTESDLAVNNEIIWRFTGAFNGQSSLTPRTWDPNNSSDDMQGRYAPSIGIGNLFYTDHGLPIEEDKQWDYDGRFELKEATSADKFNLAKGYKTVALHFNRGNRFYADLGFDGGIWYGQGKFDDNNTFHLECRANGYTTGQGDRYSPTGYYPKKLINPQNEVNGSTYTVRNYLFPFIRLAGLYLLYAEAANEFRGPDDEIFDYLNRIRSRAGLPDVQDAWLHYSRHPDKYKTKEGLREIIHREREIELMFESKRYWDLIRWKTAVQVLSEPIWGWNIKESEPELYYQQRAIFQSNFRKRDYFWPIREKVLQENGNLLQSPGW